MTATSIPATPDRRRLQGQLVVAGTAVLFGILAAAVRLGFAPLLFLDDALARQLNGLVAPHPGLVHVLNLVTDLGSAGVLSWLVGLAVIVLLTRRRWRLAAFLAVTTAATLVLDPTLKALVGRARPVLIHPVAVGGGNSFPSGHALDSLVCYGALLLVFLPAVPRRRRWIPVSVVGLVVVLVGLTRILLGVHFGSDVIGGWSFGVAWLGLTVTAFELQRHVQGRPVTRPLADGVEPDAASNVELAEPGRPDWRRGWLTTAWLVIGWVAVLGVIVGMGELIRVGGTNVLGDRTIPHWFADHRTPGLNTVSDLLSRAGDSHSILAVGLVAGAVALGLTRRWRPVVFLVVLMLGELALFLAAAKTVGRARPDVSQLDGQLPTSAFPSGHVAATLCLYAGIGLLALTRTRTWWRWLVFVPAVIMPLLVALSRLYRGMHHPTNVLAGALLAVGWLAVVHRALPLRPHIRPQRSTVDEIVPPPTAIEAQSVY